MWTSTHSGRAPWDAQRASHGPATLRPGAQALGKIGCGGGAENWAADLNGKGRLKTQLFSSAVPLWIDASEFAVAGEEGCPSDEWNIVGVQQTFPERID